MIKLDETDLELINEFIKFLGEKETQGHKYSYVTNGIEVLKYAEDKTKAFKEMFSLYDRVNCENKTPIIYAEFNNNSVYLGLEKGYVFKNENKDYINLVIKKG